MQILQALPSMVATCRIVGATTDYHSGFSDYAFHAARASPRRSRAGPGREEDAAGVGAGREAWADTTNPGGVYILAICSLEGGYPVAPLDCKYDAFKVKKGKVEYSFYLGGLKFEDVHADGTKDAADAGLPGWTIVDRRLRHRARRAAHGVKA